MFSKKNEKIFLFIFFLLISLFFIFSKFIQKIDSKSEKENIVITENTDEPTYNSNLIKDIKYTTKDADGNEYTINALQGEVDFTDPNTLYLINVKALIKLKKSENITITSNFGKYNSENFDTIFSKNVIIKYLNNKITGEYLDFSLERNSMLVSRNVIYSNLKNILKADVIELNIKTKDTKIFMYENEKKVNIKSKN